MNTVRFISIWKGARLSADKYKDPGKQRNDGRNNSESDRGNQSSKTDENEVNSEQKHADVFSEVHRSSILVARPGDNLKRTL